MALPPETFQQQQQQRPHDLFSVNQSHYPSLSLPHSRALYSRDDFSSTTPASLHNSYGRSDFFPSQSNPANTQSNDGRHPPELTPQQQQQQQQFGLMATAAANTLDQFNPGGEQSPASGVTRSRSRSRSKVSSNRNRVSKRPSLPPPPAEEQSPDSSRAPSATRPSAIVIPGSTHAQQSSHSFSSYHAGTHPASPATWGFATHTGDQYGAEASPAHQLFGTSFGGSGSLGPGQSPTTLNGSPPANPSEAAMKSVLFYLRFSSFLNHVTNACIISVSRPTCVSPFLLSYIPLRPKSTSHNYPDNKISILQVDLLLQTRNDESDASLIMPSNVVDATISTRRFKNLPCFFQRNGWKVQRVKVLASPVCCLAPSVVQLSALELAI